MISERTYHQRLVQQQLLVDIFYPGVILSMPKGHSLCAKEETHSLSGDDVDDLNAFSGASPKKEEVPSASFTTWRNKKQRSDGVARRFELWRAISAPYITKTVVKKHHPSRYRREGHQPINPGGRGEGRSAPGHKKCYETRESDL